MSILHDAAQIRSALEDELEADVGRTNLGVDHKAGQMGRTALVVLGEAVGQDWRPVAGVHSRMQAAGGLVGCRQRQLADLEGLAVVQRRQLTDLDDRQDFGGEGLAGSWQRRPTAEGENGRMSPFKG